MKQKRIIITGGGTAGSTTPLLAFFDEIKKRKPKTEFLFIGTRKGMPEKRLAKAKEIKYKSIFSGKLRRYLSFKNLLDPFKIIIGFFQSLFLIKKFKPDAILEAGGFVAVPVCIAGWFFKIPVFLHQLDAKPGLANKILSFFATKITLSFKDLKKHFPKGIVTGTPVRKEILNGSKEQAIKRFNLKKDLKTILIMGGGTGSSHINKVVLKALPKLNKVCQVIHLTGKGKLIKKNDYHYRAYEFLSDLKDIYKMADIVISRAGVGAISELSVLGKPTIFIPLPNSPQEKNANIFCKNKAAICIKDNNLNNSILVKEIKELLNDNGKRDKLSLNLKKMNHPKASLEIVDIIFENI